LGKTHKKILKIPILICGFSSSLDASVSQKLEWINTLMFLDSQNLGYLSALPSFLSNLLPSPLPITLPVLLPIPSPVPLLVGWVAQW